MSEEKAAPDSRPSSPLGGILKLIGTTGFEVAGLIIWLELDARSQPGLGLIILFIALILERLVVTGFPRKVDEWLAIIGSSWWEYAAWGLWFTLIAAGRDPLGVFALVLLPGLHFQHAFLVSVKIGKTFGELVRHKGFILFGAIEAVGGALWLAAFTSSTPPAIPAHLIILLAITIEHIIQGVVLNTIYKPGVLKQVSMLN
jgi:hypothetical protein